MSKLPRYSACDDATICDMLSEEKSYDEIARLLGRTRQSIRERVRAIRVKMGWQAN